MANGLSSKADVNEQGNAELHEDGNVITRQKDKRGGAAKPENNIVIENEAGQNSPRQLLRGSYSITFLLHLNTSQAAPLTMIHLQH